MSENVCRNCGAGIHFVRWQPSIDGRNGYWLHDKPATTGCWPPQDDPGLITFATPAAALKEDWPGD